MIRLLPDARRLLARAWSVRLALLSAVLSAAEVVTSYVAPAQPSGKFAAFAGVLSLAAAVARLVAQPRTLGKPDA